MCTVSDWSCASVTSSSVSAILARPSLLSYVESTGAVDSPRGKRYDTTSIDSPPLIVGDSGRIALAVVTDDDVSAGPGVTRRQVTAEENVRASRAWWDSDADAYQAEHRGFLGDVDFRWCPEG